MTLTRYLTFTSNCYIIVVVGYAIHEISIYGTIIHKIAY